MKKLLLFILLASSLVAVGQKHFIGVRGGVNLSNVNQEYSVINTSSEPGFSGGLTYDFHFKEHITMGADLLYFQNGFGLKTFYLSTQPATITDSFNYNYLSLPLKSGITVGNTFSGFLNLGLIPSVILNAKTTTSSSMGSETWDVTDSATKFDLAGLIEMGGSLLVHENIKAFISVEFRHSITSFKNYEYFPNNALRHYNTIFSFGIKYLLNNNSL